MLDFIYHTPTKIYFGKDKHKEVGKIIKELGYTKIMMQYGKNSIKTTGLYDEVISSLKENGITVIECGGVEANPKVSFVRNAAKIAKEEKVEFILAVGGGSVLDSSKTTALGATTDVDIWDIMTGKYKPTTALGVGSILTHSAAGSEMSGSAVLTNMELNSKRGFGSPLIRCAFSILNPELTYTVSKYQTACGIVDMMTHTLERYFTPHPDTDLTDRVSESILKSIVLASKTVVNDLTNYEARATLMWASSLAHNDLTSCGREAYLGVHQLEHSVSGLYDEVAHGAGLAVLYPAWAKFIYKQNPSRFAKLARSVFDVSEDNDEKAALLGITEMQNFFTYIGMPSSLKDFNIPKEKIEDLTLMTTYNNTRTIKSYIPLGYSEIKAIFELAY